ncbi:DUF4279 domain-containing protein [Pseudoduganella sp. DS3]|uniref:DUF4279 domain-containing protein n=1 Tax=Pseudoduganella guangdongensis TaxID=2692179 RepID=A0A6N9HJD1_9BURK|nr:DUF4279 domain-containing protein [Pseudoduganella guangdongensis]MYN02905.1 DUF4279 domain-containing protein [Pseudoduganella guangdongensis]
MSQSNESYAYFALTGTLDPEMVSRRTGIAPTDSWRKGDLHPRTRRERKFDRWELASRLPRTEELELHIADVLVQLEASPIEFAALAKEHSGRMQLVGYFHEEYPGLVFSASLVAGLAKFNLSMDFDFYALWSDARDDT